MAECNVNVHSITNALVEWDVVGEIDGFAEDTFSVEIEYADEGATKMKVAADGKFGTISANARTNGMVTLKLDPGSPFVGVFVDLWHTDRTQRGEMSVTDVETGESWMLTCAVMEKLPNMGRGTEVPDSHDFPFLFLRSDYTPAVNAIQQLAQEG